MQRFTRLTIAILGSRRFFLAVVCLLVLQALWFAFSAAYPMAFDENFHFGLIKIYANQWSPFLTVTPPFSGEFGPLTRDNSYLFHYLMSFPYRLLRLLIPSQEVIIVVLRLFNIAFFTGGFLLFYRILRKTPASRALVHLSLLIFTLIPIVPFLAAHINYDNLLFLLLPITILLTISVTKHLRDSATLPIVPTILLITLGLLVSIVKYASLPILLALGIYIVITWWQLPRKKRFVFLKRLRPNLKSLSWGVKIGLIVIALLSGGLFIERYGVNLVKYKSLVPECDKVASFEHCSKYGPWIRDYNLKATKETKPKPDPLTFATGWPTGMMFRLFFAINYNYDTQNPVLLPISSAYFVGCSGILLLAFYLRTLIRRDRLQLLFLLIIVVYTISILVSNLRSYFSVGELVAVNGRYFVPVMPLLFVMLGLAFREFIRKISTNPHFVNALLCIIVLLCFSQGGGIGTYLIRSQNSWYWPEQPIIQGLNQVAKKVVETIVIWK